MGKNKMKGQGQGPKDSQSNKDNEIPDVSFITLELKKYRVSVFAKGVYTGCRELYATSQEEAEEITRLGMGL